MDDLIRRTERAAATGDREAALRLHELRRRAGELCNECGIVLPPEYVGIERTCPACAADHCPRCDSRYVHVYDPGPGDHWTRCPTCEPPGTCRTCEGPLRFGEYGWTECPRGH